LRGFAGVGIYILRIQIGREGGKKNVARPHARLKVAEKAGELSFLAGSVFHQEQWERRGAQNFILA